MCKAAAKVLTHNPRRGGGWVGGRETICTRSPAPPPSRAGKPKRGTYLGACQAQGKRSKAPMRGVASSRAPAEQRRRSRNHWAQVGAAAGKQHVCLELCSTRRAQDQQSANGVRSYRLRGRAAPQNHKETPPLFSALLVGAEESVAGR